MNTSSSTPAKAKVSKQALLGALINDFYLSAPYKNEMEVYFILYQKGNWVSNQIKDGILTRIRADTLLGEQYLVVYHQCTPYQVKKADQVVLSFRKAKGKIGIDNAYVLIRLFIDDNR